MPIGCVRNYVCNYYDCGTQVYKARTDADGGWQGDASSGFQAKMGSAGQGIDGLGTDVGTLLTQSFNNYADGLQTAQTGAPIQPLPAQTDFEIPGLTPDLPRLDAAVAYA